MEDFNGPSLKMLKSLKMTRWFDWRRFQWGPKSLHKWQEWPRGLLMSTIQKEHDFYFQSICILKEECDLQEADKK